MVDGFLEMSTFGTLLLLAVERQLRGFPYQAAVGTAVCCWFHPVLLVPAALLTLAFAWDNWANATNDRAVLAPAFLTLSLVMPQVVYVLLYFGATTPRIAQEAANILADIRYPYHVKLNAWLFDREWLRPAATIQILVTAATFVLVPNRLIRCVILVLAAYVAASVAYYGATGDNRFSISIPWRPSVVFVPLSVALLIAASLASRGIAQSLARLITVVLAAVSIPFLMTDFRVPMFSSPHTRLTSYVFQNTKSTDNYLIPPTWNWYLFRAQTAAPILVDWKNHPLKDTEILEWYQRIKDVRTAYSEEVFKSCEALNALVAKYRVTKVITGNGFTTCPNLKLEFDAGTHKVLAVTSTAR